MSSSILRRHSSKKGLEKLQRITAQRSLEDAEEVERERRRRTRTSSSTDIFHSTATPQDSPRQAHTLQNQVLENHIASSPSSLEEDEGFSDWTHRSRRKQGEAEQIEVEAHLNGSQRSKHQLSCSSTEKSIFKDLNSEKSIPFTNNHFLNKKNVDEKKDEEDWAVGEQERKHNFKAVEKEKAEVSRRFSDDDQISMKRQESPSWKTQSLSSARVKKGEISYTSMVVLQQNGRQCSINGQDQRRVNDSVSNENREENQHPIETDDKPCEGVQRMREEEREKKRRNVVDKLKRLSISSGEPEEPFSPLSPRSPAYMAEAEEWQPEGTSSITERTESLNRSIKKKNSIKKTQPPTIISKLDGRLEQYNHAIEECSKEGNVLKQMEVLTPPEPVSARKSLFEAGEGWNQNSAKAMTSKDAEGMKVGVTDLINQWVKGNSDINMKSPSSKAACPDVKAGEVHNIKSMWENLRDSPQDKTSKGFSGKRYKFVESGHGKYEKVFIDDDTN